MCGKELRVSVTSSQCNFCFINRSQVERQPQKNKFSEGKLKTHHNDDSNEELYSEDSSEAITNVCELESCSSSKSNDLCRYSKANDGKRETHKTEAEKAKVQSEMHMHTEDSIKQSEETTNGIEHEPDIKRDTHPKHVMNVNEITKSTVQPTEKSRFLKASMDAVDGLTGFDKKGKYTECNGSDILLPFETEKEPTDSITVERPGHVKQIGTNTVDTLERITDQKKVEKHEDRKNRKAKKDRTKQMQTGSCTSESDSHPQSKPQRQESEILQSSDSKQLAETLKDDFIGSRSEEEQISIVPEISEVPNSNSIKESTGVNTSWSPATSETQDHEDDVISVKNMTNGNLVNESMECVERYDDYSKLSNPKQDDE